MEMPTPYDIIDPTKAALTVPLVFWIILLSFFLIIWALLLYSQRKAARKREAFTLSPTVTELRSLLYEYQDEKDKKALHLFVKLSNRHLQSLSDSELGESTKPFLSAIERERFAPTISDSVLQNMKEVLSILARADSESSGMEAVDV